MLIIVIKSILLSKELPVEGGGGVEQNGVGWVARSSRDRVQVRD